MVEQNNETSESENDDEHFGYDPIRDGMKEILTDTSTETKDLVQVHDGHARCTSNMYLPDCT